MFELAFEFTGAVVQDVFVVVFRAGCSNGLPP